MTPGGSRIVILALVVLLAALAYSAPAHAASSLSLSATPLDPSDQDDDQRWRVTLTNNGPDPFSASQSTISVTHNRPDWREFKDPDAFFLAYLHSPDRPCQFHSEPRPDGTIPPEMECPGPTSLAPGATDTITFSIHMDAPGDYELLGGMGFQNPSGPVTTSGFRVPTRADPSGFPSAKCEVYRMRRGEQLEVSPAAGLLATDADPKGQALSADVKQISFDQTKYTLDVSTGAFTYNATENDPTVATIRYAAQAADGRESPPTTAYILIDAPAPPEAESCDRPAAGACSDGRDNDGDGATDFPLDPACLSPRDNTEAGEPIARCDAYVVPPGYRLTVPTKSGLLANDSDPSGKSLTAVVERLSFAGDKISLNPRGGGFTYTAGTKSRRDSIVYRARNADGTVSKPATAYVYVGKAPKSPPCALVGGTKAQKPKPRPNQRDPSDPSKPTDDKKPKDDDRVPAGSEPYDFVMNCGKRPAKNFTYTCFVTVSWELARRTFTDASGAAAFDEIIEAGMRKLARTAVDAAIKKAVQRNLITVARATGGGGISWAKRMPTVFLLANTINFLRDNYDKHKLIALPAAMDTYHGLTFETKAIWKTVKGKDTWVTTGFFPANTFLKAKGMHDDATAVVGRKESFAPFARNEFGDRAPLPIQHRYNDRTGDFWLNVFGQPSDMFVDEGKYPPLTVTARMAG